MGSNYVNVYYFFGNQGMKGLVVRWYSSYSTPFVLADSASVKGIPDTFVSKRSIIPAEIIPSQPPGVPIAKRAYPTHTMNSKK
jgi:hypothetical protein